MDEDLTPDPADHTPLTPANIRQGTDNITFVFVEHPGHIMSDTVGTPAEPATPPATPADPVDIQTRPDPVKGAAAKMERSISQSSAPDKPIDIAVYFPDGNGVVLNVPGGKYTTVQELIDLVIEEKNLPAQAKQAFDLWFISKHLALQLKANHVPFKLALKWSDLLTKYTRTKEADIDIDEPALTFMRNVYFTREQEDMVEDHTMINLLFAEARAKIIHGLYPCDTPQFLELGGLLALLEFGAFNPATHNTHFYDQHITDLLPPHQRKRRMSLKGKNPREQLLESHQTATSQFGDNSDTISIQKAFLKICRELPYYGCAFFDGQIETPRTGLKNMIVNPEDTHVRVGINSEGLFVIDPFKVSLILGLTYKEFSWEYAKSDKCDEDPKNCLPCLFVQFCVGDDNKLLQIFSKQAVMMDALIDAFVGFLVQTPDGGDQTDGGGGDTVDGRVAQSLQRQDSYSAQIKAANRSSCLSNKLNRLSLTTVVIPE